MMEQSEHQLYQQISEYMQIKWPEVIYRFDLAADLKLTPGQAVQHKKLHPKRGYPDLFVAKPRIIKLKNGQKRFCHGLFIEIKKEGETLFPGERAKNRFKAEDGKEYKTEHLMEQANYIKRLRRVGYAAGFGIGFDEIISFIDKYLQGGEK